MKIPIIFNLDVELVNTIKEQHSNRSQFLNDLLSEHFNKSKPYKAQLKDISKELDNKTKEFDKIATEMQKAEEERRNQEKEQRLNAEKLNKEKEKERIAKRRIMTEEAFKTYELPTGMIDALITDYLANLSANKVSNIVDYMKTKGYKKKSKFKPKI